MEIKNLGQTDLDAIVECFLHAFSGYFVQLPTQTSYWENRFRIARADYHLSFGVFENGKLVAFIINGIDKHEGELTAFNTGTGVIPDFRNRQLVDKMYAEAIPAFKTKGIKKCVLEVVQKNDRAIRVYERIGFKKTREYLCFKGEISMDYPGIEVREIDFEKIKSFPNPNHHFYSWDNYTEAMALSQKSCRFYEVFDEKGKAVGFFILNPELTFLPQFEIFEENEKGNWEKLFAGIKKISPTVKINNVDARRSDLIRAISAAGPENYINQFEMEMKI